MKSSEEYLSNRWMDKYTVQLPLRHEIEKVKQELAEKLDRPSVDKYKDALDALKADPLAGVDFSGNSCKFGSSGKSKNPPEVLQGALEAMIPWRKGPFQYFDQLVDTEWKSYMKWDRIAPMLPDLDGIKVCDVGCNNGYYMYRMLSRGTPQLIWGLDPMIRYYFYFKLNRLFFPSEVIQYDILGVEHLDLMPDFFDLVLFMGVIYHRRDPIKSLQTLAASMRSGATLIMESSGIPGKDPVCLFPEDRYLKAPGYWFLPTQSALVNMLNRTGFKDIEIFESHKLEFNEQRQTPWAPYQSLEHFLDPEDPEKTVEGYPAPIRIYIRAKKK